MIHLVEAFPAYIDNDGASRNLANERRVEEDNQDPLFHSGINNLMIINYFLQIIQFFK